MMAYCLHNKLTSSWLAWRSLAKALSPPVSIALPTDTMKLRPVVLDFIDTGGLVSSVNNKSRKLYPTSAHLTLVLTKKRSFISWWCRVSSHHRPLWHVGRKCCQGKISSTSLKQNYHLNMHLWDLPWGWKQPSCSLFTLINPWFFGGVTSSLLDSPSDWLLLLFSWIFCTSSWTLPACCWWGWAVGESWSSFFASLLSPRLMGDSEVILSCPGSVLVWNWVVVVKWDNWGGAAGLPTEKLNVELDGTGTCIPGKSWGGIWGPGLGSLKLVKTACGPAPEELFPENWKYV